MQVCSTSGTILLCKERWPWRTFVRSVGRPTEGASFCVKCGNDLRPQVPSAPVQAAAVPAAPVSAPGAKPQGMGTAAKLLIALLVVIVVGGVLAVAATIYAAHKISEKAHAVSRQVLGEDSSSPASSLSSLLQKAGGSDSESGSEFKGESLPVSE